MFQKGCIDLLQKLIDLKYNVLLETSGSLSIKNVPKKVINIIDFKCPSSNMKKKNHWENIQFIKPQDEIKFVIGNKEDYEWAKEKIQKYNLTNKCTILMSPTYKEIKPKIITKWILNDNLDVKFQIQLHKEIWKDETRGV